MIKRLSLALLILTGGLTAQAIGYKSAESIRAEGKTKIPKRAETWFVDKALVERSRFDPAGGQRVEGLLSAVDRVNIVTETPDGIRFTVESPSLNDRVTFLNGRIEGTPESLPARLTRRFRETVLNDRGHFAVAPAKPPNISAGRIERLYHKLEGLITGQKSAQVKDFVFNPADDAIKPGGTFSYSALHNYREDFISNQNNVSGPKIKPLKVIVTPDGKYMPLNGNHRLRAAIDSGVRWLPIEILSKERQ